MTDESTGIRRASLPVGVVVVTHGQLAVELLNAAEAIVGDMDHIEAISIGWHDDVEHARAEIAAAIERVATPIGALVLTDMFGGTPSNLAVTFLEPGRVEVVTGVNLPMLLKLANLREVGDLRAIARVVHAHGQEAVRVASDLLEGRSS
ncbi:MAG TPA: PTS fructose transporter subunit IIA [Vicinamibacterales bacterium]